MFNFSSYNFIKIYFINNINITIFIIEKLYLNVFIFPVFKIKLLILNLNIFYFLCLLYLVYGL
jgi:hypothetical protein